VTSVPRTPVPLRLTMHAPTLTKPLIEDQLDTVLAAIRQGRGGVIELPTGTG